MTAVGNSGTAIITVKVKGTEYSTTCAVTIVSAITKITPKEKTMQVIKNNKVTIEVTTEPSSDVEDLTYKSDDEGIAKVDEKGIVTGMEVGSTTITISGSRTTNVTNTITINVIKPKEVAKGEFVKYDGSLSS